jgi:hypothetical protein
MLEKKTKKTFIDERSCGGKDNSCYRTRLMIHIEVKKKKENLRRQWLQWWWQVQQRGRLLLQQLLQ